MSLSKLLTPKEVARLLNLNILTIYEYMHSGKLAAIKLGRNYRVLNTDLKKFIENHRLPVKGDSL